MRKLMFIICVGLLFSCQKDIEMPYIPHEYPWWNCELVCTNSLDRNFTVGWYDHEWNIGTFDLDTIRIYFTYHIEDRAIFVSDGKGTMTLYMDGYEHFSVEHCGRHIEYLMIK